jgi:hypothetical protein
LGMWRRMWGCLGVKGLPVPSWIVMLVLPVF